MLMMTAWEALLKARILDENSGNSASIEVFENKKSRDGQTSNLKTRKKNRSGNAMTIDLVKCMEIVRNYSTRNIDDSLIRNLTALIEIRDNAVHLVNIDPLVHHAIHRTGTAAMLNLLRALQSWFGIELNEFGFVPLPIGYYPPESILAVNTKTTRTPQSRVLKYLQTLDAPHTENTTGFNSTVNIQVSFTKTNAKDNIAVRVTKDPSAPEVRLTEEDYSARYPHNYKEFCSQIKFRDSSVRVSTKDFHKRMRKLEIGASNCWTRILDPKNPRSLKKKFYSNQALDEFFRL